MKGDHRGKPIAIFCVLRNIFPFCVLLKVLRASGGDLPSKRKVTGTTYFHQIKLKKRTWVYGTFSKDTCPDRGEATGVPERRSDVRGGEPKIQERTSAPH